MRISILAGALSLGLCLLSACSGDHHTPPLTGGFRVVNGITDSATLDASISNIPTDSQNIQFGTASQIADIPEGSYDAQLTPSDSSKKFQVDHVSIDQNKVTTVLSYGTLAGGTQGGFTAEEALDAPAAGQVVVQVANAAYAASSGGLPSFGFSFTPVGGAAQASSGSGALFGQAASPISLASLKYEITVTGGANCSSPVACPAIVSSVFDSGPNGIELPVSDGANVLQLVAIDATAKQQSQYGSSVVLLLLDNKGSSTPLFNNQH